MILTPATSLRRILIALFLLALLPRLALALSFLRVPIGLDDMFQYDMLARSLVAGKGYRWYARADTARILPSLRNRYALELSLDHFPEEGLLTTHRAPGYPLLLAALYALFGLGHRFAVTRLAQAFVGASLTPATAYLALRLGHGRWAAAIAGCAVALYPILWMYPIGLASENLFLPLVVLTMLTLLEAARSPALATAAVAGLCLGAATLTRARQDIPSEPGATLRLPVRQVAALIIAAAAVLLPWMLRNSLITGRLAYVETSVGYNLFIGYHPLSDGTFITEAAIVPLRFLDDGERDRWCLAQAARHIQQDPLAALLRLPRRLAAFWGLEDRELTYFYANNFLGFIPQPWLALCYILLVAPLIALGLSAPCGMALAANRRGVDLSLALIGTALLAYVPILAEPRFHLPLIPVLAAYAAAAWTTPGALRQMCERIRRRDPAALWAACAVALLILLWEWDSSIDWERLRPVMSPGRNLLKLSY